MKKEKATRVVSHYSNFEPQKEENKGTEWRNAFYELWRYQMTWDMAYEIEVRESRKNGVFVDVLVKESYKEVLISTMKDMGFKEIISYDDYVGLVDGSKIDIDINTIVIDW